MDTLDTTSASPTQKSQPTVLQVSTVTPPAVEWEWVLRAEKIQLTREANYYKALNKKANLKIEELKQELARRDATIWLSIWCVTAQKDATNAPYLAIAPAL